MNIIYEELSHFAPVYFRDAEREKDGSISFDSLFLVYDLQGENQLSDNKARRMIPLTIDLWYKKEDFFRVLDLIEDIDKTLNDNIYNSNDVIFKITRDSGYNMNIPDPDENIMRNRLSYNISLFK